MLFAHIEQLNVAIIMLVLIGICGGFYVVPLNATLQDRGHHTVGSGHAIAIQNFFENLCMLLLIGLYTLMSRQGVSAIDSTMAIGLVVLISISLLSFLRLQQKKKPHSV